MKKINEILGNYVVKPIQKKVGGGDRATVVKKFVERINDDRINQGYKPFTAAYIAYKLSHLDLWDLKIFLGQCQDRGPNFSKYFFWAIKSKK